MRTQETVSPRRIAAVAGVIVLALLAAIDVTIWAATRPKACPPAAPFNADAWRAWEESAAWDSPVRYSMARDLVSRRLLDGRTEGEVETLLGEGARNGSDIEYDLGTAAQGCPDYNDHATLYVTLDSADVVANVLLRPRPN